MSSICVVLIYYYSDYYFFFLTISKESIHTLTHSHIRIYRYKNIFYNKSNVRIYHLYISSLVRDCIMLTKEVSREIEKRYHEQWESRGKK